MRTTTSSDPSSAVIPVTVRVEEPEDRAAVDDLVEEAFGDASVKRLVQLIRASEHWVPQLSLVATRDGELVGHVLLSTADLVANGDTQQILLLSPLAVRPSAQGSGIARRLVEAGEERLRGLGAPRVSALAWREDAPAYGVWQATGYDENAGVARFARNL